MNKIISILWVVFTMVGCGEESENLKDRLLYDSQISYSWGMEGINDSTIIGCQEFGRQDTQWVRFTFDANNYWHAHSVIDGYLFGFHRLNLIAQKEYVENLKYIHSGKWATNRTELTNVNH